VGDYIKSSIDNILEEKGQKSTCALISKKLKRCEASKGFSAFY